MTQLPNFTRDPVWEFAKRDGRIIAGERSYEGSRFFELRLWTGEAGDKPTRKGVTIPLSAVASLAEALSLYAAGMDSSGAQGDS